MNICLGWDMRKIEEKDIAQKVSKNDTNFVSRMYISIPYTSVWTS